MSKNILVLLFMFMLAFGCGKNKNKESLLIDNFQQQIALKEKRIITNEFINVRNFFVRDSFVFINNQRDDSVLMVFDLNTANCIKAWGRRGKAPDEFGAFTHLINLPNNRFIVGDFSKYSIATYSFPDLDLIDKHKNLELYVSKANRDIPQSIIALDEKHFIYTNLFQDYSIKKWEKGNYPNTINTFEHLKNDADFPHTYYFGSIALSAKQKRIVYAYRYLRKIDILDFEGRIIKTITLTPNINPNIKRGKLDLKRTTMSYIGARATDDSFYLLFIGHSPMEIERQNFLIPSYIEEYDWNGNPITRFRVNRYIHDFDIVNYGDSISFIGIDLTDEHQLIHLKQED